MNKYGQEVSAEGYGARGPYGGGVVADVEGARYGDRTVVAGGAYGAPVHAASLPYGARPYNYHGHSYLPSRRSERSRGRCVGSATPA